MKRQLLTAAFICSTGLNQVQADAGKTFVDYTPGQGDSVDESTESMVATTRTLKLERIWIDEPGTVTAAVDSNIIFMHRCSSSNPCTVQRASSNSSTAVPDRSNIIGVTQGTLSPFSRGDAVWENTMACMREVFAPFGTIITDDDPGTQAHYEIMVGGTPGQLGFGSGTGGVSPATCGTIPSSLVFVFDVWGTNSNEICATAAQEIAHSWSLDHVTDASDPMTYFPFNGRRHFKDANVTCGSDCEGGQAGGLTCTGANQQVRPCFCGGNTQNSVADIKSLFGDGTPAPPIVNIVTPKTGDHVSPGFAVQTNIDGPYTVNKAELYINNQLVKTLTTKPFAFNAPDDLGDGTHTVKVVGYNIFGTSASQQVSVIIGKPCAKPSECPMNTDTCIGGRCVPGPGAQGGLGSPCGNGTECSSGQCASTSEGSYCVEPCELDANQCPAGFACLDTASGNGMGVCFPGEEEGTGCASGNSAGGSIGFGLGFAALLFARRRRGSK
jgi:hypothetical protein